MGTRVLFSALLVVGAFVLAVAPEVGARTISGPEITGFSPQAGVVGTAVAIIGSGFTAASAVSFNGVAAVFTVVDDADIQTSVPFGATTGKITVTTPAETETSTASFRVRPAVTSFSPGWGWAEGMAAGGTAVTITGSAFTGATAVTFHGVAASFTVDSYSRITATVPAGATTGRIKVTTKVGTASSSSVFDVLVAGPGWPEYGYDDSNSGFNPNETILSPGNVSTLQVGWHDKTGKVGGAVGESPAIANGVAYVGSADGKLYALDAVSGVVLWSAATGAAIFSSPAVADGVVYIGSQDSKLYAFDAATGAMRWSATVSGPPSPPVVANGVVYVGSRNELDAFDAASGELLWSAATGNFVCCGSPAVARGIVYIGSQDSRLYAFDATSGALLWSADTGGAIYTSPTVADGVVYIDSVCRSRGMPDVSARLPCFPGTGSLHAFNAASGVPLWSATADFRFSSPAVANGVVYVGAWNLLYAFDAATGALLWSTHTDTDGLGNPAVANGVVYVGAEFWALYAFDATSGALLFRATTAASPSPPVIANGTVYFGTYWKLNAYRLPAP